MVGSFSTVHDNSNKLEVLKEETLSRLGIDKVDLPQGGHWAYYPAHQCGEIGGTMVKKMIEDFENKLAEGK